MPVGKNVAECLCLVLSCCSVALAATISVDPVATTATLGSPVAFNVELSGIADLYAFQFDIAFDATVLAAIGIRESGLFSSVGVFFNPGFIDNLGGTIKFIADSLSGPGPGLSVDGTLAQIVFDSVGVGTSSIDLSHITLLDSSLNDVTATSSGGSVTVTGTSAVPEPSPWVLLATALGGIGIAKRERGRQED